MYRSGLQIQNRQHKAVVVVVLIIKIKMENVVPLGQHIMVKMFNAGATLNRHFDRIGNQIFLSSIRKMVASLLISNERSIWH
jgi:hypothetical protein